MNRLLLALPLLSALSANADSHHTDIPLLSTLNWQVIQQNTDSLDTISIALVNNGVSNLAVKKDYTTVQRLTGDTYYDAIITVVTVECTKVENVAVNTVVYTRGNHIVYNFDLSQEQKKPHTPNQDIFKHAVSHFCGAGN